MRRHRNPAVPAPVVAAFITGMVNGDDGPIRAALALPVWDNTPLCIFPGGCDYCHRAVDDPPATAVAAGCANNHEVWALRLRIVGEIERLGRFRFDDLDATDNAVSEAAWAGLDRVARRVGIPAEEWDQIAYEEEPSDGRA
jgi:hypothetical protein